MSLAKRFFGLAENVPLYVMVGAACGAAIYTPVHHFGSSPDVAWDRAARDFGDNLASAPRYTDKAFGYKAGLFSGITNFYKNLKQRAN